MKGSCCLRGRVLGPKGLRSACSSISAKLEQAIISVSIIIAAGTVVWGPQAVASVAAGTTHVLEVNERMLTAGDGLLLGNGDLSVSVYQTADRIIWRFGKGDVWDRRLDSSDDPRPAHIEEIAHGIKVEGWKCVPYGERPAEALHGTKNAARMQELCQGTPPSYKDRPYPCPKPVGELVMQLPPDQMNLSIRQRLIIEQAKLQITCSWPSGVRVEIESFIPPRDNVLVLRWKVKNWNAHTQTGHGMPPLWFSLYRWADPTVQAFGARDFAEGRIGDFANQYSGPKATPLDPPSVRRDGDLAFIEQTFHPDPLFKDGFRCLMTPFAPGARIEPVPMPGTGEARLHVLPSQEASEGWMVVAVTTTRDNGGALAPLRRLRTQLTERANDTLEQWSDQTRKEAEEFWSRSSVRISDPLLENLWYETLHVRRATYRRDTIPPGLYLPSSLEDYSHWHGDYHTNYNFQSPFWGDYTANHLEIGDAYFQGMKFFLQIGKKIARDYYNSRGVFIQLSGYPILAEDDPLGVAPMGRMAYMTGWAVNQYWWRYLYTLDIDWLRTTGYPAIRDAALFYTDFLKKGDDGLYHAFPSNQGEDGFTGNAKDYTDRAQVMQHLRYCLRAAIQASEVLQVDEDLRGEWRERLERCAGDDGQPPYRLQGLEKLRDAANPPEFGVHHPQRPRTAGREDQPWPSPSDDNYQWYFGYYPWMLMQRLRTGSFNVVRDFPRFREVIERWRHPNGLIWAMAIANYGYTGGMTESLGIIAPLQEMMLQSWDGALSIFPYWPKDLDAAFQQFRAEGAFLVSASWSHGTVTGLEILSEKGARCRIYSPWPGGVQVVDDHSRQIQIALEDYGRLSFATEVGTSYRLRPR